jgi:hypothetical protein
MISGDWLRAARVQPLYLGGGFVAGCSTVEVCAASVFEHVH